MVLFNPSVFFKITIPHLYIGNNTKISQYPLYYKGFEIILFLYQF